MSLASSSCCGMLLYLQCFCNFCNIIRNTSRIQLVDLDYKRTIQFFSLKMNDNVSNKKMEIDAMADSISTMKLTEPPKKFSKEKWWHVEAAMNFDIENAKQLSITPEHKKDRSHYFISMIQVRLLKEKLHNMEKHEAHNVYGEYAHTKDFKDLKRSARYWSEKLLKESLALKAKLGIPGQAPYCSRSGSDKTKTKVKESSNSKTQDSQLLHKWNV